MIAEDLLERGLTTAADEYDVPDGGVERLRELLAPRIAEEEERRRTLQSVRTWRPSRRTGLLAVAAALILLVAVPIAIGGKGNSGGEGSASVASAPSQGAADSGRIDGAGVGGGTSTNSSGSAGKTLNGSVAATVPAPQRYAAPATPGGTPGATLDSLAHRGPSSALPPIPGAQARVVKTGELDLQVAKGQVSATISRLTDLAEFMRGYVSDSQSSEGSSDPSGEVTLRVPVNLFEQTVSRARGYGKVVALQTSGVDVTGQYVDLQAQIAALQATRSAFLTILSRATTIGETLAVQDRITAVQTQIDQLQGQLKVLRDQSDMSTLTVTVDQKTHPVVPAQHHQDNGFVKAVKLSVSRFVRGVEAIIGVIGPILLAVLLVVLGWLGAKIGYRTLRRRMV